MKSGPEWRRRTQGNESTGWMEDGKRVEVMRPIAQHANELGGPTSLASFSAPARASTFKIDFAASRSVKIPQGTHEHLACEFAGSSIGDYSPHFFEKNENTVPYFPAKNAAGRSSIDLLANALRPSMMGMPTSSPTLVVVATIFCLENWHACPQASRPRRAIDSP